MIIGLLIGFTFFGLCMGYIIWRFKRYRDKYREQKRNVEQLRDYAREIDETRGGLGVADDEVNMMANPMVVEMKKLDEQLFAVNLQLDTQAEKDTRTIEQLSQDRERLHAELQRVKTQIAAQQKTSATRMEDNFSTQAPAPVSSTSGLVPMEMESPSYDDGTGASMPGQERHGFGQVRRPAKKKDDF